MIDLTDSAVVYPREMAWNYLNQGGRWRDIAAQQCPGCELYYFVPRAEYMAYDFETTFPSLPGCEIIEPYGVGYVEKTVVAILEHDVDKTFSAAIKCKTCKLWHLVPANVPLMPCIDGTRYQNKVLDPEIRSFILPFHTPDPSIAEQYVREIVDRWRAKIDEQKKVDFQVLIDKCEAQSLPSTPESDYIIQNVRTPDRYRSQTISPTGTLEVKR